MTTKSNPKHAKKSNKTEAPVTVASNPAALLDQLVSASRPVGGKRTREAKPNVIGLPGLSDAHAISVRRLADDIFNGRTFKLGEVEFLPSGGMTRWSDLTPLKVEEGAKTYRAGMVSVRMISPQGESKTNIVMLEPGVREKLKALGVEGPLTEEQREVVAKAEADAHKAAEKTRRARGNQPSDARVIPFADEGLIKRLLAKKAEAEAAKKE